MQSKIVKSILGAVFAISLAFSIGTFASNKQAKAVTAFEISYSIDESEEVTEEYDEDDVASMDDSSDSSAPTTGVSSSDSSSSVKEESSEDKPAATGGPTLQEIFTALKNTFRDAWQDFVKHFKDFFRFN